MKKSNEGLGRVFIHSSFEGCIGVVEGELTEFEFGVTIYTDDDREVFIPWNNVRGVVYL